MHPLYKKAVLFTALVTLGLAKLVLFGCHNADRITDDSPSGHGATVVLRNFNPQAGFHYNIYCINHALYTCEKLNRKLVVLFDSGLYKEDRPRFRADNPYYNEEDWFSYYFEPINQTDRPLSYWKKWASEHPSAQVLKPADIKPITETTGLGTGHGSPQIFNRSSIDWGSFNSNTAHRDQEFHRIWHKYFKLRPHIQQMVDDFKRKHDFVNKYVITIHYRGTDKYNHKNGSEDNPEHPPYEFCSALVKKVIKRSGRTLSDIVTFVATDEQQFVEHMKKAGVNAVFTDAIRSDMSTSGLEIDFSQCRQGVIDTTSESKLYNELITKSVHRGMPDKSNYIKGRDVLVDAILLGAGNIFIKSRGNVSNQACWIGGPHMESIDLVAEFNAYKKKSQAGNDWRTIYDD